MKYYTANKEEWLNNNWALLSNITNLSNDSSKI